MFADDGELTSLTEREPLRGKEGARRFWQGYRSAFEQVNFTFDRTIDRTAQACWSDIPPARCRTATNFVSRSQHPGSEGGTGLPLSHILRFRGIHSAQRLAGPVISRECTAISGEFTAPDTS